MNRYQKQVELQLLQDEAEVRKKLRKAYTAALADVQGNLKDLANSKDGKRIRQPKYQKDLAASLETILRSLGRQNVKDMTEYLQVMYEDAYLGCLYGMHKDGVQLVLQPNEEKIRQVIETPAKDLKFSSRLYDNVELLKETYKEEMSRGLAGGTDYMTIAARLARRNEIALNRAYTIARTEGHRVQSTAKMTCMEEAKQKGAEVVKQWDSTVDDRTRGTHRELDGQVKELEEPFVIPSTGAKAMYPGGFGRAEEDVNCRCTLLQRARWALDSEGYKYSKLEKEIISTQSSTYIAWKNKYKSQVMQAPDIRDKLLAGAYAELAAVLHKSQGTPKHVNLMQLYQQYTDYEMDATAGYAFGYDAMRDVIIYNPKNPQYTAYDMLFAQAHELSHRMDIREYISYNDRDFKVAIESSRTVAMDNLQVLAEWFSENGKYRNDPAFSDICSALANNAIDFPMGHTKEYWQEPTTVAAELFANLSAIDVLDYGSREEIKKIFPALWNAYTKVVK